MPVIEHLFLSNTSGTADLKELETLREVILAMLLRLAEYPQVNFFHCIFTLFSVPMVRLLIFMTCFKIGFNNVTQSDERRLEMGGTLEKMV